MGSYSSQIDLGIPTDSRECIIQYYEFIDFWTDLLKFDNKVIEAKFHYAIGKISCISDSFEEFKAETVGQEVRFIRMDLYVACSQKKKYYISVWSRNGVFSENVHISSDSREQLSDLLDCIDQAKEKYFTQGKEQPIIEQHFYGDQISITDSQISGSNIGGKQNSINNADAEKKGSMLKTIFETIISNIASNAIWWLLGIIVAAILMYLGVNNL